MKLLGLDWGRKKIGIAVASHKQKIALPLETANTIAQVKQIINQEKPDKIIIGLPLDSTGGLTQQAKKIKNQAQELNPAFFQKKKCHIEFIDESFTTKASQGDKDKSAAVLILQEYLDNHF